MPCRCCVRAVAARSSTSPPHGRPHGSWGTSGIAKAAVEALTRALAVQGAPHRIRANGVSPGWIATEAITGHEDVDRAASLFGRMGTPDEIARTVMFLASEEASFVTG